MKQGIVCITENVGQRQSKCIKVERSMPVCIAESTPANTGYCEIEGFGHQVRSSSNHQIDDKLLGAGQCNGLSL